MNSAYIKKLELYMQKINVSAQKIDRSSLNTFEMAIASFQVQNKSKNARFFQKTFLIANTKRNVILRMLF